MGLGIAIAVEGKPDQELAGATWVEVQERLGAMTTFRIHYEVDVEGGNFPFLADTRVGPGSELGVIAPVDGKNNWLVRGPVTGQQIHFEHGGSGSWVEVIGADAGVTMDRETKARAWADVADSDAVSTILSDYSLTSDIETSPASHLEDKHTLVQRDTDYRFVQRLAHRNGYLFWIDYDPEGSPTGRFKRPPVGGRPACDLIINLEANTLGALDLEWDSERPVAATATQLNLNDKEDLAGDVDESPLTPLGSESLAAIGKTPRLIHLAAPVDDASDLTARSEAALIEAGWFLRGSTKTTVNALKKLVRAHTLVNVRGAGSRMSGKYLVSGVRHFIDSTGHRMEIELLRNAWETG
jgi:hypothetical protein